MGTLVFVLGHGIFDDCKNFVKNLLCLPNMAHDLCYCGRDRRFMDDTYTRSLQYVSHPTRRESGVLPIERSFNPETMSFNICVRGHPGLRRVGRRNGVLPSTSLPCGPLT